MCQQANEDKFKHSLLYGNSERTNDDRSINYQTKTRPRKASRDTPSRTNFRYQLPLPLSAK